MTETKEYKQKEREYNTLFAVLKGELGFAKLSQKEKSKVFDDFGGLSIEALRKNIKTKLGNEKLKELEEKSKACDIKAIYRQEEAREAMSKFILDPNKIMKIKPFTFFKLNKNIAAFGLLLNKEREIYDKKGIYIGTNQVLAPAVITSNERILEVHNDSIKAKKIKFEAIPSELNLRWSLTSLKKFLEGECSKEDGLSLFNSIREKYKKYLYFQNECWYDIHVVWDIGTYFFMLFHTYPLFELRGLKSSGKTKTMSVSGHITLNSTGITVNPSEATLFRETHDKRPTKYIDECEKLFTFYKGKVDSDSRMEVINSSFTCNGSVPRVEKIGNRFKTVYYHTYSPTMLGSINGLYGATEDRAIVHISVKASVKDKRGELEPTEDSEDWQAIRDSLYIYALQNWKEIEKAYNSLECSTKLKARDYQIWRPILAIAKVLDKDLYESILKHAERLTSIKSFDSISEGTLDHKLIMAIDSQLDHTNKTERTVILCSKLIEIIDFETRPHPKTISNHVDGFGFKDYKVHTREGVGWELTYELFESLISPIFPLFASPSSQDNNVIDAKPKIEVVEDVTQGDANAKSVTQTCDANDANDANDAKLELKDIKKKGVIDEKVPVEEKGVFRKQISLFASHKEVFILLPESKQDIGKCSYCGKVSQLKYKDEKGNYACSYCAGKEGV